MSLRRHPVLAYGVCGAVLWSLVALTGVQYDDGGFGSAFWWLTQLFCLPYWLIREGLFLFVAESLPLQTPIVVGCGLALCAATDAVIRRIRSGP